MPRGRRISRPKTPLTHAERMAARAIWSGEGTRPVPYIAGPMSGYEDFNFPAFFEAESRIASLGWDVVNPARLDTEAGDGGPGIEPMPHEHYMRRDLPQLWRCTHIALLDEWWLSRGARIELGMSLAIGLTAFVAQTFEVYERAALLDTLERTRQPGFIV